MATRSHIGILHKNGTVETVYCHHDGYLSGNGKNLYKNYNSLDIVKKLLEKGNMSSLDDIPEKVEYYVDRGEDLEFNLPYNSKSLDLYKKHLKTVPEIEFVYLFDEENNQWICSYGMKDQFYLLKEELKKNKIIEHEGEKFTALTYYKEDKESIDPIINEFCVNNENLRFMFRHAKIFYYENGLRTFFWESGFEDFIKEVTERLEKSDCSYSLYTYDNGEAQQYGDIELAYGDIKEFLNDANLICPSFQKKKPEYLENFMYIKFVSDRDFETARSILADYKAGKTMIASKRDNTLFWKNFSEEDLENLNNIILFFRRDRMREVYKENSICAEYSIILRTNETGFFRKIGELDDDKAYASLKNYLKDHNMTCRKQDFLPEEDESPSISM